MSKKNIEQTLEAFDERYYRVRPQKSDIDKFGESIKEYCKKIDICIKNNEREEHIKNILNEFLKTNFYSDTKIYEINSSGNADSTIRVHGIDNVLIEVKKPSNTNEMVSENNINKKSLWELTYYFLQDTRNTDGKAVRRNKESEIKHLIITDSLTWIIIDATELDKFCDGHLEKQFWKYSNNKLTYAKNTVKFYEEIKDYFDKIDITHKLNYTEFNIKEIYKHKPQRKYLYKILSKEFLLKEGYNVEPKTNVLNNSFYQELLYIMGLKEQKEKNNIIITIDHSIKNSLANQVYNIYVNDKGYDGTYHTEAEAYDKTFELLIIWINRLLFIKLFEGQLIMFNSDDKAYKILDNSKIKDFQDLQNLFFNVLGRKTRDDDEFYNQFSEIPYLNSSLFEQQSIERNDINIKEIRNLKVTRTKKSSLGKRAATEIPLLEYIISFLNSYDFSSQTNSEENTEKKREIIDAAVLGLIFEKLNGYKDGAVYTPSAITEYMCKYTIEKSIIDNVNKHFEWNCTNLDEIKFKITSLPIAKEINDVINSIKICDPAVGSGHFLVSALNRIIAVKAQLGVLFKYGTNEPLREVNIFVLDDVLRITDGLDNDFIYDKNSYGSRQIQQTLFNEKRTIIEDMLFGVDTNSKAVHICQLRLWIELLKNAYYDSNGVMETLPNIDINIKVGNSLISRYDTFRNVTENKELASVLKRVINQYKDDVKKYKSESDKNVKKKLNDSISTMKFQIANAENIQVEIGIDIQKQVEAVEKYRNAFEWAFEIPEVLDENGKFTGFDIIIGNPPYIQLQKMGADSDNLQKQNYSTYIKTGDIYCLFYERGCQLLKKGGILTFITSNKWMRAGYGEALRNFFATNTNPTVLIDFAGVKVFDNVTVETNILSFEKSKNKGKTLSCTVKEKCLNNLSVYIEQNHSILSYSNSDSWIILSPIEESIKAKIEAVGIPLKKWDITINYGIKTGCNDAFIINGEKKDELIAADPKSAEIIRPILRGRDIKRYGYNFADLWLINTHNGIKSKGIPPIDINNYPAIKAHLDNYFDKLSVRADKGDTPYNLRNCIYTDDFSKQKIVWGELSDEPKFALDKQGEFIPLNTVFLMTGKHLEYLLSFLNSPVSKYFFSTNIATTSGVGTIRWLKYTVETLPIPKPNAEILDKMATMMSSLDKNNTNIEQINKLNILVYSLYGFTSEEIDFINKF